MVNRVGEREGMQGKGTDRGKEQKPTRIFHTREITTRPTKAEKSKGEKLARTEKENKKSKNLTISNGGENVEDDSWSVLG
jgi:hypothetical protein